MICLFRVRRSLVWVRSLCSFFRSADVDASSSLLGLGHLDIAISLSSLVEVRHVKNEHTSQALFAMAVKVAVLNFDPGEE